MILADSRGRKGLTRARRVDCAGPSDDRRPERDLERASGRYACTAVTSRVVNADGDKAYGVTGYPYRAVVHVPHRRAHVLQGGRTRRRGQPVHAQPHAGPARLHGLSALSRPGAWPAPPRR